MLGWHYNSKSLSNRKMQDTTVVLGEWDPVASNFWEEGQTLSLKQLNTSVWNGVFRHTLSSILLIYYLFLACVWWSLFQSRPLSSKWCRILFIPIPALFYGKYLLAMTFVLSAGALEFVDIWVRASFYLMQEPSKRFLVFWIIQLWIICLLTYTCPFSTVLNSGPTQVLWETILL